MSTVVEMSDMIMRRVSITLPAGYPWFFEGDRKPSLALMLLLVELTLFSKLWQVVMLQSQPSNIRLCSDNI